MLKFKITDCLSSPKFSRFSSIQRHDHFLVFFPVLSQTIMHSLLCVTSAVEKAFFHTQRIRQIHTVSEIFSARVHFHFGRPPLRSVVTEGRASRFEIYSKDQPMHFGCMNVMLLYSDNRHVSATHAAIFRVVSARLQTHLQCVGITPQLISQSFS